MCACKVSCLLSMSRAAVIRECTGSFSSVSNTAREVEEELLHHQQRQYNIKPFLGSSPPEMGNDDGDLQHVIGTSESPPAPPAAKKKRSLPGTPDPSAEVIALSPRTLMATNRFVCEICHKGFQRDQNLQLHRRGHNLPWKLRQRGGEGADGPPRKRVYVCPEASCVHHNPSRALGDLTGIKKHYCRKHGEKKWNCERCAKRYAVHSDWKAHAKVCGTREYKCDCGTVFSRRDSFVTHRAFCDALAQENNKLAQPMNMATVASALQGQAHHLALPSQADDDDFGLDTKSPQLRMLPATSDDDTADANPLLPLSMAGCMLLSSLGATRAPSPSFFSGSKLGPMGLDGPSHPNTGFPPVGSASMSATALLQKAAEMGATTSGYGTSFSTVGFGPMLGGSDHLSTLSPFGPCDGLPLGQTQLFGFDAGGLLPGQLYSGGEHGVGSLMHGGQQMEHRRPDDVRVVDYMGVSDQRGFNGVGPFGPHMGPWT
ncbi:protein indeterminate-domain 12-like [Phragmites australis]|uniref:protein indeterminate-domain 12-like n=1 Tax=Phragmites australis TaxID=29695 RepID=UPI002D785E5A|nr:protein indeterminate-domain 12-like [Phragmites australis]